MNTKNVLYSSIENGFMSKLGVVSDAEFAQVGTDIFDALPYTVFKMSAEDLAGVQQLLPNVNVDLIKESELKCKDGVCQCGRSMNLLDVVAKAVQSSSHSTQFLEDAFNGNMGKLVVSSSQIAQNIKEKLPPNTMFVDETAPIPCINCGREQDVALSQGSIMHYWRL